MLFRLVLRNLRAHPLRSALTFGSVFLAVFLLCVLRATTGALTSAVEKASKARLWVQSAVSLYVDLPLAYGAKVAAVEGVDWVCRWQWFGGYYQDESSFFAQFGVDPSTYLKSYPEVEVVQGSYDAFQRNRTGCLIGEDLATEFGWKVGDSVPILSKIFHKLDGSAWDFRVDAVYRSHNPTVVDQRTLFFHFDYLRETIEAGAVPGEPAVGVYMVKLADGANVTQVMADIDALFANGPQRVQTTTEGEFQRSFVSMLGNVPLLLTMIGSAVLFAIFFAVLNTMMMAARERVRHVGIMKALGFADGPILASLVLEAVLLCGAGGLLGAGACRAAADAIGRMLAANGVPGLEVGTEAALLGLGLALGVGLIAGAVPGWQLSRLSPVRALRDGA